jgi:hypothetical protein
MNFSQFADATRRGIASTGIEDYLPTVYFPDRPEFAALENLPTNVEPLTAVLQWAAEIARPNELHLVALKSGPAQFTVVRIEGDGRESADFDVDIT